MLDFGLWLEFRISLIFREFRWILENFPKIFPSGKKKKYEGEIFCEFSANSVAFYEKPRQSLLTDDFYNEPAPVAAPYRGRGGPEFGLGPGPAAISERPHLSLGSGHMMGGGPSAGAHMRGLEHHMRDFEHSMRGLEHPMRGIEHHMRDLDYPMRGLGGWDAGPGGPSGPQMMGGGGPAPNGLGRDGLDSVVMFFHLDPDRINCDRLFNLACLYGNVNRVRKKQMIFSNNFENFGSYFFCTKKIELFNKKQIIFSFYNKKFKNL